FIVVFPAFKIFNVDTGRHFNPEFARRPHIFQIFHAFALCVSIFVAMTAKAKYGVAYRACAGARAQNMRVNFSTTARLLLVCHNNISAYTMGWTLARLRFIKGRSTSPNIKMSAGRLVL
ncbi:MAG: hypothetical protein MJE68_14650, partial [Proteobacteria bacterium]|nr:hypothetical protein [Pseudomonadota bacterium]